jgi:hypothetical protein
MGCWNATSFLTNLPIQAGDEVACFYLNRDYLEMNKNGISSSWHWIPDMPIFGEYNDYGSVENFEDTFSLKFLKKNYKEFNPDDENCEFLSHENIALCEKDVYFDFVDLSDIDIMADIPRMKFENEKDALHQLQLFKPRDGDISKYKGIQYRSDEENEMLKNAWRKEVYGGVMGFKYFKELYKYPLEKWVYEYIRHYTFMSNRSGYRRMMWPDHFAGCQSTEYDYHLKLLKLAVKKCEDKIKKYEEMDD